MTRLSRRMASGPDGPTSTPLLGRQGVDRPRQRQRRAEPPIRCSRAGLDKLDSALTDRQRGRRRPRSSSSCTASRDTAARKVGDAAFVGGGTIFTEPILVVNQKAKLIELNNQYSVFDQNGAQIASVNQVGQSAAKKVVRLLTSFDQFMTHKLEIADTAGRVLLRITRPAKVMKSTVIVSDGNEPEIGRIVQDNVFGKIHFALQAGGQHVRRDQGGELAGLELPHRGPHGQSRWPGSPRRSKAWRRRCSPRPTTTSCRSTARSRSR